MCHGPVTKIANTTRMMPGEIQLDAVGHTFPSGTRALQNVTLSLDSLRFTALIGRSGAGKSTLLRILNGLVRPSEGAVWVRGVNLAAADHATVRAWRRQVGMVFQQFGLVRRLSGLENILLGRLGYLSPWRTTLHLYPRADREFAMALLARVGLADQAWQRADTLSGGQQQRVAIARALAQRPRLILADEPVSALDPQSAEQVMDLLRAIHLEDNIAVVANLHSLDTVRAYADRVIALQGGHLLFDGPPDVLTDDVTRELYYADEAASLLRR